MNRHVSGSDMYNSHGDIQELDHHPLGSFCTSYVFLEVLNDVAMLKKRKETERKKTA
jgi:hypothetical protein